MIHIYNAPNVHCTSSTWRPRRLAAALPPRCCSRTAAVVVTCQARVRNVKKPVSRRVGVGKRKGFGNKPQKGWETELLHPYRVYYKQGYKPPRYQGSLQIKEFEDGSIGLVVEKGTVAAEPVAISHPVAFLEGTLGAAPPVEDLHAALLESQLKPSVLKVLQLLPQRPLPVRKSPSAAASTPPAAHVTDQAASLPEQSLIQQQQQPVDAAAPLSSTQTSSSESKVLESSSTAATSPSATHTTSSIPTPTPAAPVPSAAAAPPAAAAAGQLRPEQLYGGEVPVSMEQLMPALWEELRVGPGDVQQLGSRPLMRMLQASSWAEEFRDPAVSQVRHERPCGFIGVWPEFALLRHSCVPNSSAVVVDRYMLIHATDDVPEGGEVTANKLGSVVTATLAARQSAHLEMFGRPCNCRRCSVERQLDPEVAAELQAVSDKAQGEWMQRWQSALEGPSAGLMTDEEAAEALTTLQAEVNADLQDLDEVLAEAVPDKEERLMLTCAAYPAYDLAWQMEDLLMEAPDLNKLAACVALLRMFARGSEGHFYTALLLQQLYAARVQELDKKVANMSRKTTAMQRRLTNTIQELLAGAELANYVYAEAVPCRYGILPDEGLLPQLEEGITLFYAGLSALSTAQDDGLQDVPNASRELVVDGIPVTVTDTVEGVAADEVARPAAAAAAAGSGGQRLQQQQRSGPRVTLQVVDAAAAAAGSAQPDAGETAAGGESTETTAAASTQDVEGWRRVEPVAS